jgi:hypothetical protein
MGFTLDGSLIQRTVASKSEITVEYDSEKLVLIKASLCVTIV